MKKIAVLGPNPAWQKTLFFKNFIRGAVNRARRMEELPSGKGINFCRALKCHGRAESLLIQFCGGENGSLSKMPPDSRCARTGNLNLRTPQT